MEEYIALITAYAEAYGIFFITPFLILENVPFVGLLTPGLTVLFFSGFFSTTLPGGPIGIFLLAYASIVFADTLWYAFGYWNRRSFALVRAIAKQSPNVETLLTTQKPYVLMLYQFIPYFRMFLPFALGMYRYRVAAWVRLVTVGSFLYTAVFFGLGYATALLYGSIIKASFTLQAVSVGLGVVAATYGIVLIRRYIRLKQADLEQESIDEGEGEESS